MNQKEKESALKNQPVHPSDTGVGSNQGLTFYQSLILSLARNPDVTNKKDQSALAIAMHIKDVADRVIEQMSKDGEPVDNDTYKF